MSITYTVKHKNKMHIFGNYPSAATFVKHWSLGADERLEITEWRKDEIKK